VTVLKLFATTLGAHLGVHAEQEVDMVLLTAHLDEFSLPVFAQLRYDFLSRSSIALVKHL